MRTLIVDLDFLISYIEAGSFQWVDVPFDYKGANFSNFKLEEEKSRLEYAKKIVALLELLGCKKDLSIKSLKDKDWKHIGYLVTALVDKEPVEHLRTDLPPIMTIDIGELKFIVCLRKTEGKDNRGKRTFIAETKRRIHGRRNAHGIFSRLRAASQSADNGG